MPPLEEAAQPSATDEGLGVHGVLWLAASVVVSVIALIRGALWLELPEVVRELRRLVGNWEVVGEATRRVDCTPWGLKRSFVITQDSQDSGFSTPPLPSWSGASLPVTGLSLWNGAIALSRHLTEHRRTQRDGAFSEGNSVIELGCGQALVSMVVLELFSGLRHVVATDGSEDVLCSAEANISRNMGSAANGIEIEVLRWSYREDIDRVLALNSGKGYDVILCADVTYMADSGALISTILELCHEKTEVFVTHEPRRRSVDGLAAQLRDEFQNVTEFAMELTPEESGRDESIQIMGWHCQTLVA